MSARPEKLPPQGDVLAQVHYWCADEAHAAVEALVVAADRVLADSNPFTRRALRDALAGMEQQS